MLIFYLVFPAFAGTCCYECSQVDGGGNECLACNAGFVLQGFNCALNCASGYTESSGICSVSGDLNIIDTEFGSDKTYTGSTIGEFSSPGSDFYEDGSLIPTSDRGFYSSSSAYLTSAASYGVSPDFSVKLQFLCLTDGLIFSVPSFFQVNFNSGYIKIFIKLYSQTSADDVTHEISVQADYDQWASLKVLARQTDGESFELEWSLNGLSDVFTCSYCEPAKVSPGFVYIGDEEQAESFQGFVWRVKVSNYEDSADLEQADLSTCGFLQYFDGDTCSNCGDGCGTRVNCWSGETCNACAFDQCYPCNGFDSDDCAGCTNGETAPYCCDVYCVSCESLANCLLCRAGKVLVDGVCLEDSPYGLTDSSVSNPVEILSLAFDTLGFGDYSGFSTGSDDTTFFFSANGEADDPYPVQGRGLYFPSGSYIEFSEALVLGHTFTVILLLRTPSASTSGLFSIPGFLSVSNVDPLVRIQLLTYQGESISESLTWGGLYLPDQWNLITLSTTVLSSSTLVSFYLNSELYSQSKLGLFRMSAAKVSIGKDPSFEGFVYSLQVFQGNAASLAANSINLCQSFDSEDCVVDCDSGTYFSQSGQCAACDPACAEYCFKEECSPCNQTSCLRCSGFELGMCEECSQGSYLDSGECLGCPASCLACEGPAKCLSCESGYGVEDGVCECQDSSCGAVCRGQCFYTCGDCDLCEFEGCSSCEEGWYLLFSTCSKCPLGYEVANNECSLQYELVFDMKFSTLSGLVYDSKSHVLGITGSSGALYPGFEPNDPIPSRSRGFYFNGYSSLVRLPSHERSSPSLTFSPSFTIELWVYPQGGSGSLFCKQSQDPLALVLCVRLDASVLVLDLLLSNNSQSSLTTSEVFLSEWTYLSLSIKLVSSGSFALVYSINSLVERIAISEHVLEQFESTAITIAARLSRWNQAKPQESEYENYFNGFVYQIKVFNKAQDLPVKFNSRCKNTCEVCASDGTCLPACDFGKYLDGSCLSCGPCERGCDRNDDNCSLCGDLLCEVCGSLDKCSSCVEHARLDGKCACEKGFYLKGFYCESCADDSENCLECDDKGCAVCAERFFVSQGKCSSCQERCSKCNETECLSCIKHSYLKSSSCVCYQGYEGSSCSYTGFYLSILNQTNLKLSLIFSEDLESDLSSSQIFLTINQKKTDFSMQKYQNNEYLVKLKPGFSFPQDSILQIDLQGQIISINGSLLKLTTYKLPLQPYTQDSSPDPSTIKEIYEYITYTLVPIMILSSVYPKTLSCLWNFLNYIQLFSYIYLVNVPFSKYTRGLVLGLRKYSTFGNVFIYLSGKAHEFAQIREFGFKTNLFIRNIGNFLTGFFICVVFWVLCKGLNWLFYRMKLFSYCGKVDKVLRLLKYSFFIRVLIQTYLEFVCAGVVGLVSSSFEEVGQVVNFFVSLVFVVGFM